MSDAAQGAFAKDSWQTTRNARTLRAYMALQNQEIGARLRELRRGRPQTTVADDLKVSERAYQNWEAGDAKPSYRNLQRLAEYYSVSEEYILTGMAADAAQAPPAETPSPFNGSSVQQQLEQISQRVEDLHKRLDALSPLLPGIEELLAQAPPRRPRRPGA